MLGTKQTIALEIDKLMHELKYTTLYLMLNPEMCQDDLVLLTALFIHKIQRFPSSMYLCQKYIFLIMYPSRGNLRTHATIMGPEIAVFATD